MRSNSFLRYLLPLCVVSFSLSMSCEEDAVEPATQYTITSSVIPVESGKIVLQPQKDVYEEGEQVAFIAQPNDGFVFLQWSGDLEGTADTQATAVSSNMSVTAEFKARYTIETSTSFSDMPDLRATPGEIILEPSGGTYAAGEEVQLIAAPRTGFRFVEWSGDISGTEDSTVVSVDSDVFIQALFEIDCPQINSSTECYQILYPNGGEVFHVGDTVDVLACSKNEFCDFSQTGFLVSVDNGINWFDAGDGELDGTVTTWVVPDTLRDVFNSASVYSDHVKLKIEKYNFPQVYDITDADFTIAE